ncbi:MAG: hypothetical protein GXY49_01470 [Syntrophomonadaceae bacterium]|nr:hypothetical protein [Syntrophomonadaceae bacterium]
MFWETAGPANTDRTLQLAVKKGQELGVNNFVIASCSGATARKLFTLASPSNIVCVSHQVGFAKPGEDEMLPENREFFQAHGVPVLTTTHLLAGVDRALRFQFKGVYPAEIVASTLRMFGQGIKVAVEISCMALDAGMIPYGQDVIAIGGTIEGVDAAIVIRPEHSAQFFASQVKEIICMPKNKK